MLSVVVTHNRLQMTQRTLATFHETVTLDHDLLVVDNASEDGTREWLLASGYRVLMLPENMHVGYAVNAGFRFREGHDVLHRSDNDVIFLPGWCEGMLARFAEDPEVVLVGLRTAEGDEHAKNPGGNAVICAWAWDQGLRYPDVKWDQLPWHDAALTRRVVARGWKWSRVLQPGIVHMGSTDPDDPYFRKTMEMRGASID